MQVSIIESHNAPELQAANGYCTDTSDVFYLQRAICFRYTIAYIKQHTQTICTSGFPVKAIRRAIRKHNRVKKAFCKNGTQQ